MAAFKPLSEQISDITECPICAETFTDPKALPCLHTFCLKCLLRYGEHQESDKPGDQLTCPLCRTNFVIPPGGFADVRNDDFVNRFVNQLTIPDRFDVSQKCDACAEDNLDKADVNAAMYCAECRQHLCENCGRYHKKLQGTKSHKVVSLVDKRNVKSLTKVTASYCVQHPDEQIKIYCYDCKMVTCVVCHVTEHSQHKCSDIAKSAEKFRQQLDDDIVMVTSCVQQSRDKLQQLEKDNEGFLKNLEATQEAIFFAYNELKFLVDSHLRQLMEEVSSIKIKHSKEIECKRNEMERQCVVVESFKKYCEEMKEKGTACDISRAANGLHTRSAELVKAQELYNHQQLGRVELIFTPSPIAPASAPNLIGSICCSDSTSLAGLFVTNCKVLNVIKCSANMCGIALLGSVLYLCTARTGRVVVYDLNTKSETRHFTVPGMMQPRGFAACKQNNCLYVSDYVSQCIHRVDLSNTLVSNWSLNAAPRGVSMTRAFNLLVTLPQSIKEYTTTGRLIRSVKLDTSLDNPQHSIELSSGQFVICHEGRTQHRVCIVDAAGRIVNSYGGSLGSSTDQFDIPYSLAVDTHDYVFVADYSNSKVQVLSPTLTRLGDVTTPGHQLKDPYALHLDELNGRLYAADSSSKSRVFVLSGR